MRHRWPLSLLLCLLVACTPQQEAVQDGVVQAAAVQEQAAASAAVPALVAVEEAVAAVAEALPVIQPDPVVAEELPPDPLALREGVHPDALALVVAFEVISPAYYRKALQGIICPPGASGPTGGIGYDFGHQSQRVIRQDWGHHPDVERLVTASKVTGVTACRAWRARHLDIRIPLDMAQDVFARTMVPTWLEATRWTYPGIEHTPAKFEGGIFSNTFNRGTLMRGPNATEKLVVRDECVPTKNSPCAATQVRRSCRIWVGTDLEKGLCRRRNAEADLIESPS